MNEGRSVRATAGPLEAERSSTSAWVPGPDRIVVGKDVLELLSSSMYVDPMTIFREYIQNSADSIDEARVSEAITSKAPGNVAIQLDAASRLVRIRDNGMGLPWERFVERICNLGASAKRGTAARGFRGVGRLSGLGYCQELTFRSRSLEEGLISELRWDCRRLKAALRSPEVKLDISDLVRDVVTVRRISADNYPNHFFEVELKGVIRHRDDRLLNPQAVAGYLSQVAPVPFAPDFRYGGDITAALGAHVPLGDLDIRINGSDCPIYRPYQNRIDLGGGEHDRYTDLEFHEIPGVEGGVAAVAWILHHGYSGAIPNKALVKGLRLRTGNMQVGDHTLLEELFPEPRFNAWSVGEIHVVDNRVIPNGRRDHFEQNVHLDNIVNHLGSVAKDIARRCRQSSIERKWLREFELHRDGAIERAKMVARGGLSKAGRKAQTEGAAKSLATMQKIANQRHLADETRATLHSQATATAARVAKLLEGEPKAADPLARFRPQERTVYERMIGLIYECAGSRVAARALVDKILIKLGDGTEEKSRPSRKKRRRR